MEVWFHVGNRLNKQIMKPGLTVEAIWKESWSMVRNAGGMDYVQTVALKIYMRSLACMEDKESCNF